MKTENTIQEKRTALKTISNLVKEKVQAGEFPTINSAIVAKYAEGYQSVEFKTLKQWNEQGKRVKKGEKAFPIWGRPQQKEIEETADEFKFYPVAYIFSSEQVQEPEGIYTTASEVEVKYKYKVPASQLKKVSSSADAVEMFKEIWSDSMDHVEEFKILLLNRANKILGYANISKGGVSGTVVDSKVIFQIAIKTNCSSIILCHNHPSGNTTPSEADKTLTKKIKEAGSFLEIQVLDHVILTSESYYSFADEGLI